MVQRPQGSAYGWQLKHSSTALERDKGVLRNSKRKETAPDAARETQKPDWDAPMPNKLREKIGML